MTDTRFIEQSFPVKEVSEISRKEKNVRHGHISTLHIWWARRPLAASRATAYAALIAASQDIEEWQKKRDFIIELSRWENSLSETLLEHARKDILEANNNVPPRILDPFSGGGSFPLEALRLGGEVYANDYNPVAVLILKATLEYPQKFGSLVEVEEQVKGELFTRKETVNPLLEAVKKWGNWVLEEARKDLAQFYPHDPDGAVPVGYIWSRTIPCQNPNCQAEIPLMRQFWLAKKTKKKVALYLDQLCRPPRFTVVGDGYAEWPTEFDPDKGTVSRAHATCPYCGTVVDAKTTSRLFQEGKANQRMVALVLQYPQKKGKYYRAATAHDEQVYYEAARKLVDKRDELMLEWGLDPIPDEPLPPVGTLGFRIQRYGMTQWGDLFNSRQKLEMIIFADKVRQAHNRLLRESGGTQFTDAIAMYLAIAANRIADRSSLLCRWDNGYEKITNTMNRQALPMLWDYCESNPFSKATGDWRGAIKWVLEVILHCSQVSRFPTVITQASATSLSYPDSYFDTVLTDPPYYDNVPYSYLSDFFYVWFKRTIGHIYPDLFSTPLSPKSNEIVAYSHLEGGYDAGKRFFENTLKQAFQEIRRVLKQDGMAVIVYAHKSTEGWETLINSLLDSGLVVNAAWPINTEMKGRLRDQDSAALASSIYIIARKMERRPTGFYHEIREELNNHLGHRLKRLWEERVSGADFFVAAIGSAIEIFGKYEQVMDFEGNIVRANRLLNDVQTIATDYAVHEILQNGFSEEVSELTRFYVLWRWNYGDAKVPFDEARKLAQSCGVDLSREWKRAGSFIRQQKDTVRLLGPQNRTVEALKDSTELLDILHYVLLLWEKGKRDTIIDVLSQSRYGRSEAFYRVAQAISQTLQVDNREKKLLDGFLAGRGRVQDDVNNRPRQQKLL